LRTSQIAAVKAAEIRLRDEIHLRLFGRSAVDVAGCFGWGLAEAAIGEIPVKAAAHTLGAKDNPVEKRCKPGGINKNTLRCAEQKEEQWQLSTEKAGEKACPKGKAETLAKKITGKSNPQKMLILCRFLVRQWVVAVRNVQCWPANWAKHVYLCGTYIGIIYNPLGAPRQNQLQALDT